MGIHIQDIFFCVESDFREVFKFLFSNSFFFRILYDQGDVAKLKFFLVFIFKISVI